MQIAADYYSELNISLEDLRENYFGLSFYFDELKITRHVESKAISESALLSKYVPNHGHKRIQCKGAMLYLRDEFFSAWGLPVPIPSHRLTRKTNSLIDSCLGI